MEENNIDYVLPVVKDKPPETSGKKKKLILLLVAVVLAAAIIVGLSFLLPKSVKGTWELTVNPEIAVATADQIDDADRVYYIFEKPNRYGQGKLSIYYAGGVEYRDYKFVEVDGVEKINLGSVDLEYKIKGSKLLGTAKMTLIYPEYTDESTGQTTKAEEYIFEQARAPKYEKESYDDYETDDELLGEWASNERTLSYYYYSFSYIQTLNLSDNGIMTIHYESSDLMLDRYVYYAYTAKDNELTFSLVTDKDTKYTVAYEFDDDGNLRFIDDATNASIFADAFFGDFTFYTPKNLPEPTQASTEDLYAIE